MVQKRAITLKKAIYQSFVSKLWKNWQFDSAPEILGAAILSYSIVLNIKYWVINCIYGLLKRMTKAFFWDFWQSISIFF